MTRTGNSKSVGADEWRARRAIARSYLDAARTLVEMLEPSDPANPAMSQMILAAIAYSDAVTGLRLGRVNQMDHAMASALLDQAVGKRLPQSLRRVLAKLLREKDAVQYAARITRRSDAEAMMTSLQAFADWAEAELEM